MSKQNRCNHQQGIVALSIVIVISVVLIAVLTSLTFLSLGEAQSGFSLTQGESALDIVEGCAEDALLKARSNASMTTMSFNEPNGIQCGVTMTSKTGGNWTMDVTTNSTNYSRSVELKFSYNGYGITMTSWKEL